MDDRIISFLRGSKKKTVPLGELEKLMEGDASYEDFAAQVIELEQQGVLKAVKQHGFNHKSIPLANTYRIYKSQIPENFIKEMESYQFHFHPRIKLDNYYTLGVADWSRDLPYIQRIDTFLKQKGLPNHGAAAPERSYALVGDEKWIDEKGGRRVLEKLGLWEDLKIETMPDPLMLAVNTLVWEQKPYLHLVVENKTPYYALLDTLKETPFLSLIYGAGWKITADIVMLEKQLGLINFEHQIYYFGDLDYEGISIWHALDSQRSALPATEFYRQLLARPWAYGKENQQCNEEALTHFLSYFTPGEQEQIRNVLEAGGYYPQEGLDRFELEDIWRQSWWR